MVAKRLNLKTSQSEADRRTTLTETTVPETQSCKEVKVETCLHVRALTCSIDIRETRIDQVTCFERPIYLSLTTQLRGLIRQISKFMRFRQKDMRRFESPRKLVSTESVKKNQCSFLQKY